MVKEIVDKGISITTILVGVVLALLTWNVKTTQDMSIQFAVLKEQVVTLTADRYTGTQASSRRAYVDNALSHLDAELSKLETKVNAFEKSLQSQ